MTPTLAPAPIPLVNLQRQYAALKAEIDAAVADVMARQAFIHGERVAAFTKAWLAALGATHGSACGNGTAAISVALRALGIGPGDEVITTAHTFFATAEAIFTVGATPAFTDIDPRSYTLDIATATVTPRTRAILPVHLYGGAADMDAILALAAQHNLKVIEDTAQAHLASHQGRALGTIGDAGTFSFYPGKNLGAYGDAGFTVARDAQVAALIAKLVDHGRESKYAHDVIGDNLRMDEIQAAVLSVKLPHLPTWTARRQAIAAFYDSRLKPRGFKVIEPLPGTICVYHLYVVEVGNRDEVLARLKAQGIAAGVHYPLPLHRQPALARLPCAQVRLPHTERTADRVLSLPICGDITDTEAERVINAFLSAARP
ncbi:MAG: DegT/DnrJ/EryC1/StrS family aminotransferase [Rhodospirillaceae bacterium]|nr:DegT/DnrJ/EryC1/StrS family aminotransferase [Rhodospirillaceae bacterium]